MQLRSSARAASGAETTHEQRSAGGSKGEKMYTVDYSKPILAQVPKLGSSYEEWVHKPSAQLQFRMFESDFFEWFATMSWPMVPIIWIPISTAFAWAAMNVEEGGDSAVGGAAVAGNATRGVSARVAEPALTPANFAAWWIAGLFLWTISEYALHRFIFHGPILSVNETFLQFHFLMHGQHHKFPLDKGRLVFPLVPATITGAVLYTTLYSLLPFAASLAAMSGLVIGYIAYDLTHYYVHHGKPQSGYFRSLRQHHMQHHFRDQDSGFGITSTTWDFVFSSGHPAS